MGSITNTQTLLVKAKQGDQAALEALFMRYRDPVLARIRKKMNPNVRSLFDSQDFLHDVFIEASSALPRFERREPESLIRWFAIIVRNRVRDAIRRMSTVARNHEGEANHQEEIHLDPTPSQNVGSLERKQKLEAAMTRLAPEYQTILRLRDFEGLSFEEIAKRMGKDQLGNNGYDATRKFYWRALRALSAELQGGK